MSNILYNCQKWCSNWNGGYSLNLTKFKNTLYVAVSFLNGNTCYYKTDLHNITELLPSGKDMIKWNESGVKFKLEKLIDHIIDIDVDFDVKKCELYTEILCSSLNNTILNQ